MPDPGLGYDMNANTAKPKAGIMVWIGRIITALIGLAFGMGGVMDVLKPGFVVKGSAELGYPESCLVGMGIAVLISVVLYLLPRTTVLGAMLLTAYMGGAVASHVRAGQGPDKFMVPVVFGVLVWIGPWLRDGRLRALAPWRFY